MKFFSLAVALLCAVAVSAAPSSIDDGLMLIDVDEFGVVEDINAAIQGLLEKVKCSVSVIGQVLQETDLKTDYLEYKSAVESILKGDLQKCAELEGLESKLKCALSVGQKLYTLTADFTQKLEKTNKELAAKIVESLKSQCFNHEFDSFQMSNELSIHDELTFGITDTVTKVLQALLEKVKCSMKAINELVVESDLLDIFKEFKDEVESVLKTDAKNCLQAEGLSPKIKCALAVSQKLTKLFAGFVKSVLKENKDLGGKVIQAINQCIKNEVEVFELNEVELMHEDLVTFDLADTVKKVIEELRKRIKCSINGIEEIVGEGELRSVYQKFRADLESLLKTDAKQCLEANGVVNKLKCALSVTQKLNKIYANLIREVRKTNKELAHKVVDVLKTCLRGDGENVIISNEDDEVVIYDAADVVKKNYSGCS